MRAPLVFVVERHVRLDDSRRQQNRARRAAASKIA
jgi:hypothetical protein